MGLRWLGQEIRKCRLWRYAILFWRHFSFFQCSDISQIQKPNLYKNRIFKKFFQRFLHEIFFITYNFFISFFSKDTYMLCYRLGISPFFSNNASIVSLKITSEMYPRNLAGFLFRNYLQITSKHFFQTITAGISPKVFYKFFKSILLWAFLRLLKYFFHKLFLRLQLEFNLEFLYRLLKVSSAKFPLEEGFRKKKNGRILLRMFRSGRNFAKFSTTSWRLFFSFTDMN